VVPKYLLDKIPKRKRTPEHFNNEHRTAINDEIRRRHNNMIDLRETYKNDINSYSLQTKTVIENLVTHYTSKDLRETEMRYKGQIDSLIIMKRAFVYKHEQPTETVINLTNKVLTKLEKETLGYGINMTWPLKINQLDIKVESEFLFNKISKTSGINDVELDAVKTSLKTHYTKIVKMKEKTNNKVKSQVIALHNLAKEKNIYYAKFDKGNGICIENRDAYINKMNSILSDTSKFKLYTPHGNIKKNFFIQMEETFNRKIKTFYDSKNINKETYDKIRSVGSQPARLYGLPKIHKDKNNPKYRPILSMPNAYCTNLAKYLDELLKPFLPEVFTVKDSFEFKSQLSQFQFKSSYFLVSFDVTSLFTNVPVEETIEFICQKMIDFNKFPMNKQTLKKLLLLACKNVLFSFNNIFYQQHDGMCMGSNLGPTMAGFAMHMIEEQYNQTPLFYKRYVDDIFAVFKSKTEADNFFNNMNLLHNNIKFTKEEEQNGSLNFLDLTITRNNNILETEWHIKSTNTGTYLHKSAFSPQTYKKAAIRSLIYRAYKLSSNKEKFEKAYEIIENIFIQKD